MFRVKEGLNPSRILVVTFDNAAATSLLNHLKKIQIQLPKLRISTLNSFGYWVLREFFPKEFKEVIPAYRARRLFREVREALKQKSAERHACLPRNLENNFYIDFFGLLKNELFDPRRFDAQLLTNFLMEHRQAEPFFSITRDKEVVKKIVQAVAWLFCCIRNGNAACKTPRFR